MSLDRTASIIVLSLLLHSLLFSGLILFTLLSCQLDLNSVHAPDKSDFALRSDHQVVTDFVEKVIVSLQPLLSKFLSVDFPDTKLYYNSKNDNLRVTSPYSLNFKS